MTKLQYLGLCGVLAVGSFLGGRSGILGSTAAHAQTRVQNQDYLLVPNGGLRLMTEQGRPVGVIGNRNGNGVLILFDAAGQPSVTIGAGAAGKIALTAESGAALNLSTAGNERTASLTATSSQSQLSLSRPGQAGSTVSDSANGGRLTLMSRAGKPAAEVFAGNGGGQIALNNDGGINLIQMLFFEGYGRFDVKDPSSKSAATVFGTGSAQIKKGDEIVWKAPAD